MEKEPRVHEFGVAPVKAEFVKSTPAAAVRAGPSDVPSEADGQPAADTRGAGKRKRGMNKASERDHFKPKTTGLCTRYAAGAECDYGERCKYSHDLAAYHASRREDLPGECPIFVQSGFCRHGVSCRFGSTHVDAEGRNVIKPGCKLDLRQVPVGESNFVSGDALAALRRRQHVFPKSAQAVREAREATAAAAAAAGGNTDADALADADADVTDDQPPAHAEVGAGDEAGAGAADVGAPAAAELNSVEKQVVPAQPIVPAQPSAGEQGAGFGCSEPALRAEETRPLDLRGKLYLAPLTTVGNLPFRRLCVSLGADVTCSEMAISGKLLQGEAHEWALLRRHESEKIFGVQIAGSQTDMVTRTCEAIAQLTTVDFVDINMGCPIDSVCNKGMGAVLCGRPTRIAELVRAGSAVLRPLPLTVKLRTGVEDKHPTAHKIVPLLQTWGAQLCTLHGRSRQQRYARSADWEYIGQCAALSSVPLIGNGDVYSHEDLLSALARPKLATVMVARGALIKPWVFTELKEQRAWDISAQERLEQMRQYTRFGLEHWGADEIGVSRTRHFLLEWISFTCRYVPVGLLEVLPPRINDRPPAFCGRSDLETMLASTEATDWVKLTEMLLGPVPAGFHFVAKHKASGGSGPIVAEG